MTVIPQSLRTRIESNFWSAMVALMDNSRFARQMTPKVIMGWRRLRDYVWIAKAVGFASGGMLLGFITGLLAKYYFVF